mgnify:CR=1 FL=1
MDEKISQIYEKKEVSDVVNKQPKESLIQKKIDILAKPIQSSNLNILREFASSNRNYINHYIFLADTKATFLIGISSSFLIKLYSSYHLFFLKSIRTWDLLDLISFFSLTSLIIAITSAISVVFPRLITNKNKGLVSWVDISNYESSNDYLSDLLKKNEEEIMKEHYSVNYFLSLVCKKKYYWMSLSFIAMIIGMMLGIIVFVNI